MKIPRYIIGYRTAAVAVTLTIMLAFLIGTVVIPLLTALKGNG
jgi:hypothetical protein